jgi:hypothetical protein
VGGRGSLKEKTNRLTSLVEARPHGQPPSLLLTRGRRVRGRVRVRLQQTGKREIDADAEEASLKRDAKKGAKWQRAETWTTPQRSFQRINIGQTYSNLQCKFRAAGLLVDGPAGPAAQRRNLSAAKTRRHQLRDPAKGASVHPLLSCRWRTSRSGYGPPSRHQPGGCRAISAPEFFPIFLHHYSPYYDVVLQEKVA